MKYLLAAACLFTFSLSRSQGFSSVDYPQGYFRNPLEIPIRLAANFGELRPNHYHMGLDIRTAQRENLPVFAAADGYVCRVVVEPGGFGQAIYIRHPNGYTTLYAHVNAFYPALAVYVSRQQYKSQSWELSLEVPAGLFPVKKGDQIALSGNRGGSQGPHLHFEIRRSADDTNLNPLLFGMPVPDNTSPGILRLAIYDRTRSTYEQTPLISAVHKSSGPAARPALYAPSAPLFRLTSPRVSFGISAFDTQTGSANPNGVYQATLFVDERPLIAFRMNDISYGDTRNINAHIDYKTRATGGPFIQHVSKLYGYPSPSIYRSLNAGTPAADGVIDCSDGVVHQIRIEVRDANGNNSELRFKVQYSGGLLPTASPVAGKLFYPGMIDGLESGDCAFYLGEKSLYDSVHIAQSVSGFPGAGHSLPGAVSALHTIGATYIPLMEPMLVRIRPNLPWTDSSTSHIVMVCMAGERKDVLRPDWQGGWASARFRSFGNFQLVDDREAPTILPVDFAEGSVLTRAKQLSFKVRDNLGAIAKVRATLDPAADSTTEGAGGQWLCFSNDKGLAYIYTFDEHCPAGQHTLMVEAWDVAGNKTVKLIHFTR